MQKTWLVTGGAGFIGGNFVLRNVLENGHRVITLDKLTYAGNLDTLQPLERHTNHLFVNGDINDAPLVARLLSEHQPDAVVHFAAESHVDRSIDGPADFIETNIQGTFTLLQQSLGYYQSLSADKARCFRFLHVSTDEVYGSLGETGLFTEGTPYDPSSPYSASKAASDHLVRAWHCTYGLPTLITNCSNNYGPYQFPEKLIPLMIEKALAGEALPVYGDGLNVRDWLYVIDHCRAIETVLEKGAPGETYNVGGNAEKTNLEVVHVICDILDRERPVTGLKRRDLITFVKDRPGHDRRYAIDSSKLQKTLGWRPQESFASGLEKTIRWYLDNRQWVQRVQSGAYQGQRLGNKAAASA